MTGGVGLATLGVASYFGLRTRALVRDAAPYCYPDGCDEPGYGRLQKAENTQTAGLILAGAGYRNARCRPRARALRTQLSLTLGKRRTLPAQRDTGAGRICDTRDLVMADPFDVAACDSLASRAASGDAAALRTLVERLWPAWLEIIASSRSMGTFARSEDHVRNVATRLVEKVQQRDGHALRLYALWLERHPGKNLLDWIRIITANAVRDYVTAQLGPRQPSGDEPSAKRLLNEFASSALLDELGVRPKFNRRADGARAARVRESAFAHGPTAGARALARGGNLRGHRKRVRHHRNGRDAPSESLRWGPSATLRISGRTS